MTDDRTRAPWTIRLVIVWAIVVIAVGVVVVIVGTPETRSADTEIAARASGRLVTERILLSLVPLASIGVVVGRARWAAIVLLTAHTVVAMALLPRLGLDALSSCVAWLLLLSPSAKQFFDRTPPESKPSPPTPTDRARIAGAVLASGLVPGSGQMWNRNYRRAAVHFLIWAAAWVTHLQPVWVLSCLYSMCEAGWTAAALARARRDPQPVHVSENPRAPERQVGTSNPEP